MGNSGWFRQGAQRREPFALEPFLRSGFNSSDVAQQLGSVGIVDIEDLVIDGLIVEADVAQALGQMLQMLVVGADILSERPSFKRFKVVLDPAQRSELGCHGQLPRSQFAKPGMRVS